ncbi:SGNH/GDSL hydrolase family protein [Prevotella sp. E9-3]|uniref:SGNH/GDSL hydrolase family protein n=1 Tax=Prevotella sp. E9-3 TaxID=2913621 RepID=UPI001ED9D0F8|nr:SGNH/GDSL hydrolase family protein [Prevotella sp. E9-3]UKK49141.1 SGNH/GDSL hydrolase family protein [Prevotella sp. E9-3]
MNKKAIFSLLLTLFLCLGVQAQQVAPFKKGDRVTFVGNSITDGGHYHSYIWLYYMTHFPFDEMWMANCGVGGDTSLEILNRLDGDVFAKRPTVLTLTFGMNDSGYFEYNGDEPEKFAAEKLATAKKYYYEIEKRLKARPETRMIMIGTSPYDQTSTFNDNVFKNKNNTIGKIVAFQDSAAKANNWEFVDFWAPMNRINEEQQKVDPAFTICGNDRIHPDNDGHLVMAYLFLKAQGMAGKKIADVQVNAKQKKVLRSENCEISNVENRSGVVTFDYLAHSLPFPLDTIPRGWEYRRQQAAALKVIPQFMEEMDNEAFSVTGLKGNYQLLIDNEPIDTLTATQLAKGINLASYRNTPQYQQAKVIMELNENRWEIERQFRDYSWLQYNFFMKKGMLEQNDEQAARVFRAGQNDGWVAAKRGLYDKMIHKEVRDMYIKQMDMIVERIYEINKPQTRKVKLLPVK